MTKSMFNMDLDQETRKMWSKLAMDMGYVRKKSDGTQEGIISKVLKDAMNVCNNHRELLMPNGIDNLIDDAVADFKPKMDLEIRKTEIMECEFRDLKLENKELKNDLAELKDISKKILIHLGVEKDKNKNKSEDIAPWDLES